jgi:hypothetical protein
MHTTTEELGKQCSLWVHADSDVMQEQTTCWKWCSLWILAENRNTNQSVEKECAGKSPSQQSQCSNAQLIVRVSPASKDVNAGAEDAMMLEDNW